MSAAFCNRTTKTAKKAAEFNLMMEVVELEPYRLWIFPGNDAGKRKRDTGPGHIGTQGTL